MKFYTTIPLLLAVGVFVTACGGGTSSSPSADDSSSAAVDTRGETDQETSPSGTTIPDGARLLASQCFQCHGTDGYSRTGIDSLSGESGAELVDEMLEMVYETDDDLMHYQARGYSEEQVRAIAAYIASLSGYSGGEDDYEDGEYEEDELEEDELEEDESDD